MKTQIYCVAQHYFSISIAADHPLWSYMQPYEPFMVDRNEQPFIFEMKVVESVDVEAEKVVIPSQGDRGDGMVDVEVRKNEGGYLFRLKQPFSDVVNSTLYVSEGGRCGEVALSGEFRFAVMGFTNAIILNYLMASAPLKTVLLHSSTVIYKGESYLFLGKSGTGKSTHSRMWLEAFEGVELLNDDHPIVRVHPSGEVITYGSPWSGKTHCYKNQSAPLAAAVRIEQAPVNQPIRLRPSFGYGSIVTSCSGLQWDRVLCDCKSATLGDIVTRIENIKMCCLPNREAAEVCYKFIEKCRAAK